MSDDEYYSENDDSESEISENDIINSSNKKPLLKPLLKPSINIKSYIDIDDSEPDDVVADEDEDEDDEIQLGGDDYEQENDDSDHDSDDSDIEIDEDGEPIKKDVSQKLIKSTQKIKKTQLIVQEEDEDEDEDENYLQKFDNDLMKNYINEFHPECLSHNYDEITKLSIVVRNSDNIIIDPLHKTIPYLTKYEKARILGQRAKQIEGGAKPLVKIPENIVDSYIIAELELKEKKIPFIIRRPIPGGACEYWNLKDLEMITF